MRNILTWAGCKKQLLDKIKEKMPEKYNTYIEPFFGSGALYFDLCPEKAIINDKNNQLINVYHKIKTDPEGVDVFLRTLERTYDAAEGEEKKKCYYDIRSWYNQAIKDNVNNSYTAAEFIFLNRCCFNGLYRVNKKGEFNVPWGKKQKLNLPTLEELLEVSKQLKTTDIYAGGFGGILKLAEEGDFVFLDPPYDSTFTDYQAGGFDREHQIILAKMVDELVEKGIKCMITNSNTDFIKELYSKYNIEEVNVKHLLNRDGKNRDAKEVIITTY